MTQNLVAEPVRVEKSALRIIVLFAAILMSGGSLIVPRIPLLAIVLIGSFINRKGAPLYDRRMVLAWFWLAIVTTITLLRPDGSDIASTATRLANFAAAVSLVRMYLLQPDGTLARDLGLILPWVCWLAILTVPFQFFFGSLAVPIDINDTPYETFFFLFTWHVLIETSSIFIRPDGIFYEPGVLQIYLNLFLFISLFVTRNWRNVALSTVGVFATQSTTGVVICAIQFAALAGPALTSGNLAQRSGKALGLLIVLVPIAMLTYDNVVDKFSGDNRGSTIARQYDLLTAVNIIVQYPLAGIGFDHERFSALNSQLGSADTELREESALDRRSSNGLLVAIYSVGIPLGLIYLLAMLRNPFLKPAWLLGTILLLSLSSEALPFTPFFAMFALGGMMVPARRARPSLKAVIV